MSKSGNGVCSECWNDNFSVSYAHRISKYSGKLFLLPLIVILMSIVVLAGSNPNIDIDSGLYIAWDIGERSITNTSPANTDEVSSHGWTLSSGSLQYSNDCGSTETTRNGSLCYKDISGTDTYMDASNVNVTNVSCEIFHRWDSSAGTQGGFWEMFEGANRVFLLGTHSGSAGNYAYCIDGGGCYQNSGIAWNNGTSAWTHYQVHVEPNNISLYANGVLIIADTSTNYDVPDKIRIWGDYSANTNKWDELRCWQGTLADQPQNVAVSPTPVLSMLLEAYNGTYLEDTQIDEDTNFFPVANYTLSGTTITSGVCNATMNNITSHFGVVSSTNFTLTDSDTQLSLIMEEGTDNIIRDYIDFQVCRQNIKIPLQIYVNGTLHRELDQNIIPLCSVGFHQEINITEEYIGDRSLNITLRCDSCDSGLRQHTIILHDNETLHFERDFTVKTENLDYNVTSELYEYHRHQYHATESGIINLSVTCNESQTDRILSVGDVLPQIKILAINNVTYTDGVIVEANTQYNVLIDVFGDVISTIDFNVTYANGTLINQTSSEINSMNRSILDLDGLYNISIFALDDEGNSSSLTGFFNVSDTTIPTISWNLPRLDNTSEVPANSSTSLAITVSDLNLFAYQVIILDETSTQKYNFSLENINTTSVLITDSITPTTLGNWTALVDVWDAHTDVIIKDIPNIVDGDIITFENNGEIVTIDYIGAYPMRKAPKVVKEYDRYTIEYNFDLVDQRFEQSINHKWRVSCGNAYYLSDSEFLGHVVCWDSKMWYDAEDEGVLENVIVQSCGQGCYDIMASAPPTEIIKTRSVGILNNVHQEAIFLVTPPTTAGSGKYDSALVGGLNLFNLEALDTSTTSGVLMHMFLFIFILSILISFHIIRIPILHLLSGIMVFFYGWLLFVSISAIIGFMVTMLGLAEMTRVWWEGLD